MRLVFLVFGAVLMAEVFATPMRTVGFEYDPNTGLLIREVVEPGDSNLCVASVYTYDAYGNRTGSITRSCNGTSSAGLVEAPPPAPPFAFSSRSTSSQFQAGSVSIGGTTFNYPAGQFATTSTNALNHSESRTFDPRFGGTLSLVGPNNLTTSWAYDGFGRKTSETRADGTATTLTYTPCGTGGSCGYAVTATTTGTPTSTTRYDALGALTRVEVQGFDGSTVFKDTDYDSLGRVRRASRPYLASQTPAWTTYTYDILGRVVSQTDPAGATTAMSYSGLMTSVTNALNQTEVRTKNSQGQLTRVVRQ